MSPRTGRPKTDKPKSTQLAVRLDDETLSKLDEVAEHNSETRVQTIRRGIDKLHSELDGNKKEISCCAATNEHNSLSQHNPEGLINPLYHTFREKSRFLK